MITYSLKNHNYVTCHRENNPKFTKKGVKEQTCQQFYKK